VVDPVGIIIISHPGQKSNRYSYQAIRWLRVVPESWAAVIVLLLPATGVSMIEVALKLTALNTAGWLWMVLSPACF